MEKSHSSPIRIAIIDDHHLILEGLAGALSGAEDLEVIGRFQQVENALESFPQNLPEVLLLDVNMPELNGIEAAKIIRASFPTIRILALSSYHEFSLVQEMLKAGAQGYAVKTIDRENLLRAIRQIASGKPFFSEEVTFAIASGLSQPVENAPVRLSPREKEVVGLIAREFSNKEIADHLHISERTVETHRKSIFRKTEAKSVVGLVKLAIREGWIEA
ncbi:MAG: response regulator transcription factor [Bacteroidia bacterium]|nr:response regulator transcription factor [Bacteroidia bacterium]